MYNHQSSLRVTRVDVQQQKILPRAYVSFPPFHANVLILKGVTDAVAVRMIVRVGGIDMGIDSRWVYTQSLLEK